jgi:chemotaxis protein MotB
MIDEEPAAGGGTPAWVVTFADLMSLLMCFFVLLLSFSEMDAQKFKEIAGEMSKAFGVQREVPADDAPMGSSIIFTNPTAGTGRNGSAMEALDSTSAEQLTAATAAALREALSIELTDGGMQLDEGRQQIVLRVEENGSFPSGSADVTPAFEGLLSRMAEVLSRVPGDLTIEGHTDDVPIRTARFQSNWDLSAARAAAVANALLRHAEIAASRLRVEGHAETDPREPNADAVSRARNRRVEIIVDQSGDITDMQVELDRLRAGADGLRSEVETQTPSAVGQ